VADIYDMLNRHKADSQLSSFGTCFAPKSFLYLDEPLWSSDLRFASSNQDHSKQFHGYLAEDRQEGRVRLDLWEQMTFTDPMMLDPSDCSELRHLPAE
jgi:hypothetical protein